MDNWPPESFAELFRMPGSTNFVALHSLLPDGMSSNALGSRQPWYMTWMRHDRERKPTSDSGTRVHAETSRPMGKKLVPAITAIKRTNVWLQVGKDMLPIT